MIEGVRITPLRQICDERGAILHMLRCDDPEFTRFGEIYFSLIYPGAVKAWHLHTRMTLNYAVVRGMIKLVLYDGREGSASQGQVQEIYLGERNYVRVRIPPGVHNGFKAVGGAPALVANCSDLPHDAAEIQRFDPHHSPIPYRWELVDG